MIYFLWCYSKSSFISNHSSSIAQYILVYTYVSLTFIGTGIVSTFAFTRTPKWLFVGALFVTFTSLFWFTMSILSFFPSLRAYKYLCIMDRCPPTHWIFEVPWRSGHVQFNPLDDYTRNNFPSPDATSSNPNSTTDTTNVTSNSSTHLTTQIDLNRSPSSYPNATGPLSADCDHRATISNEYLRRELHDLMVIEKMTKRHPSNTDDDKGDEDTRLDNVLYDHESDEQFQPHGNESHTNISTATTKEQPFTQTSLATTKSLLSDIPKILEVRNNDFNDTNSNQGIPNQNETQNSGESAIKKFMSSVTLVYSKDMFGGNLALSVLSFVIFSAFLVYGLVCMFYLHKQLVRRKREREKEDDEEEEEEESRISLYTHPSRKSQRSQ